MKTKNKLLDPKARKTPGPSGLVMGWQRMTREKGAVSILGRARAGRKELGSPCWAGASMRLSTSLSVGVSTRRSVARQGPAGMYSGAELSVHAATGHSRRKRWCAWCLRHAQRPLDEVQVRGRSATVAVGSCREDCCLVEAKRGMQHGDGWAGERRWRGLGRCHAGNNGT